MALKNTVSGGKFVKMTDYADAKAILFEPKDVEEDVPNTKFGGTRDLLHTDMTVFDKAALDGGKPVVLKNVIITEKAMVNAYKGDIRDQFVAQLKLKPNDKGRDFYVPVGVDDAIYEKVAAYLEQREAAIAELMASGPDFLDGDDD